MVEESIVKVITVKFPYKSPSAISCIMVIKPKAGKTNDGLG